MDQITCIEDVEPILDFARQVKNKICAVEALTETIEEAIDDCVVPLLGKKSVELDSLYVLSLHCILPTTGTLVMVLVLAAATQSS